MRRIDASCQVALLRLDQRMCKTSRSSRHQTRALETVFRLCRLGRCQVVTLEHIQAPYANVESDKWADCDTQRDKLKVEQETVQQQREEIEQTHRQMVENHAEIEQDQDQLDQTAQLLMKRKRMNRSNRSQDSIVWQAEVNVART